MMTVEMLKNFGADTQEGLSRCMNNEAFYLRLVGMGLNEPNFDKLQDAVARGNAKEAFEAAHALKGMIGNLSLTPIYTPLSELTERLRGQEEIGDVSDLMNQVMESLKKARALNT